MLKSTLMSPDLERIIRLQQLDQEIDAFIEGKLRGLTADKSASADLE